VEVYCIYSFFSQAYRLSPLYQVRVGLHGLKIHNVKLHRVLLGVTFFKDQNTTTRNYEYQTSLPEINYTRSGNILVYLLIMLSKMQHKLSTELHPVNSNRKTNFHFCCLHLIFNDATASSLLVQIWICKFTFTWQAKWKVCIAQA
jgi:hypothetical protein